MSRHDEAKSKAASSRPDASEVAQELATLVADRGAVSDEEAAELRRLVGHSLAAPSPAELRNRRIGLLIDLVAASNGEFVSTADYETARQKRLQAGETHPDASTISRAFGHWLAAVNAASRFWFEGGRARVPSQMHHARLHATYEPREIQRALLEARRDLCGDTSASDDWPTEWEFHEYCAIRRRLARRAGKIIRLPSPKQIRKAYGSYTEAVEAVKRSQLS